MSSGLLLRLTVWDREKTREIREGGRMRFHATVLLGGKTATGIRVPPEVVERLGSHKRPPVRVTIGS